MLGLGLTPSKPAHLDEKAWGEEIQALIFLPGKSLAKTHFPLVSNPMRLFVPLLGYTQLWLRKLGLEEFKSHYPFELSGGMKQKLAIARAFVLNPEVLILDEPFANLDMQTRERMQEELAHLAISTQKTILMVTHSIEEAVFLADRIIVLTNRPARVRKIVVIDVQRPRKPSFRFNQNFLAFNVQISKLLKPELEEQRYANP